MPENHLSTIIDIIWDLSKFIRGYILERNVLKSKFFSFNKVFNVCKNL